LPVTLFALLTKNLIVVGELGPAVLLELLQPRDASRIEAARAARRLRMTYLSSNLVIWSSGHRLIHWQIKDQMTK